MEKHKNVLQEIENVEKKLQTTLNDSKRQNENSDDALDSYMSTISSEKVVDKLEARKYRVGIKSNLSPNTSV